MKKQLLIGTIGNDKVILEIELRNKSITDSSAITMALTPIEGSTYQELSISGSIGNHQFGQIYNSINPSDLDELYMDRDQLIHLIAIWKVCHLNSMNAGTLLQTEYINFWKDQMGNRYDYDNVCAMLKQHHLLIDNETNPQLTTGYKYGTLWLINYLPESVIQFVNDLQSTSPDKTRSAMMDYLLNNKFRWDIRLTDTNPHMQSDQPMDHWKVTIIDDCGDDFETYFSTGFGHRLMGKNQFPSNANLSIMIGKWMNKTIRSLGIAPDKNRRDQLNKLGFHIPFAAHYNSPHRPFNGLPVPPMPDQVIECITSDWLSIEGYHSWEDWATDLGFDLNSKTDRMNARRSFETTITQSEEAQSFFGSNWNEICDRSY